MHKRMTGHGREDPGSWIPSHTLQPHSPPQKEAPPIGLVPLVMELSLTKTRFLDLSNETSNT